MNRTDWIVVALMVGVVAAVAGLTVYVAVADPFDAQDPVEARAAESEP